MTLIRTIEQQKIIDSKSKFMVIMAYAGATKTTVLRMLANENKNYKILYIAYNRETAYQAQKTFPNHVTSKTAHSLAYPLFGSRLKRKLDIKTSLPFKAETIRKLFSLKRTVKSIILSKELKSILENFCSSKYLKIEDAVPFTKMSENRNVMLMFSNVLWQEMTDPVSKFPSTADVYLKQYNLSNPVLNYDMILFDETQDANPLMLNLILMQKSQRVKIVFVADNHQSIYFFRGSKNVLKLLTGYDKFYLTKSFRFGCNIAYVADLILKVLKKESIQLTGNEMLIDRVGIVDKSKQFSVISRTNSNVMYNAILASEKNLNIFFVGGFRSYNFKKILDIENLFLKNRVAIKDLYIKSFETFESYKNTAIYTNDKEMKYYIKIVEKSSGVFYKTISNIKHKTVENINNADVILSTVHKSKGLEFKQVILANDFKDFIDSKNNLKIGAADEEEANLLYVALTRAVEVLQLNRQVKNIIKYYEENIKNKQKSEIISSGIVSFNSIPMHFISKSFK